MRKILLTILIFIILCSTTAIAFTDTENHWAKNDIERLTENSVINGYEDGTFRPDENIKINEFIKILMVASRRQLILEGEMWPDWYINTAKAYKIINEFDDYERLITRNEVAEIIANYIDIEDMDRAKNNFIDLDSKYKNYIMKLNKLGIINGYEDNTFRGKNNITRAEAVSIIVRAVKVREEKIYKKKVKLDNDAEPYTNINRNPSYETWVPNRYEIKNNKIYIYDGGRYRKLSGYKPRESNVSHNTIIKLLESLTIEDKYSYLGYIPDEILLSQIIVGVGEKESYIYNGNYNFFYTFYEGKTMNLKEDSQNEIFSDDCFMKITIGKMWSDLYEYKRGGYICKEKFDLLCDSLETVFDKETSKELSEYIKEKIVARYEKPGTEFAEVRQIGKYTINCYMKRTNQINFYISK